MTEYNIVRLSRKTVTVEQMKETEKFFKKIDKKNYLKSVGAFHE